jgi:hypothetical protein
VNRITILLNFAHPVLVASMDQDVVRLPNPIAEASAGGFGPVLASSKGQ